MMLRKFRLILSGLLLTIVLPLSAQDNRKLIFDPASYKGSSGYFRVAKTREGQWWFLTPDGQPFYYKGVCAVNRAGTMGGRRAQPGPYAATIDRKYNYPNSPDAFVNASLNTLRSHGFNALGAWATEEFFNRGMPFTEIIEFFKEGPFLPSVNNREGLPDLFDPQWMINADRKARALCAPLRYSKDLVGYFTDNEIGFGKIEDTQFDLGFQAGQFDYSLLRLVLAMDSSRAAYKDAWKFVLNRHGNSFQTLSDHWKVEIRKSEDMKILNNMKARISDPSYDADAAAFSKWYAERYFKIVNELIRRYDPNHLILGCRFGGPPPFYVLDAMKPWVDVISANNYQPILYDRYDTIYRYTGLPLLIGEVSWNTDLFKQLPYASERDMPLSLKERMFKAGTMTLQQAARHDGIVGFTWYRWVQGVSTEDRFFDGVVNYNDEPDIHSKAHKMLLPSLEEWRRSHNGGAWKQEAIHTGEMNLFPDSLRPGWKFFLRLEWKEGSLQPHLTGWKVSGRPLTHTLRGDQLNLTLEVLFAEQSSREGVLSGGKGNYNISLKRSGEKWTGDYDGIYEGKPIKGKLYAFYFPAQKKKP